MNERTSAGLLVTGTLGVTLIHSIALFLMVRRIVRLQSHATQHHIHEGFDRQRTGVSDPPGKLPPR
jgi:hypothetical protein